MHTVPFNDISSQNRVNAPLKRRENILLDYNLCFTFLRLCTFFSVSFITSYFALRFNFSRMVDSFNFLFFFFHKKKTVWNFLNNPKLYLHNCVEIWWIWPFVLPKKKISRPSMTMISNQVNHIPTTRNIFCIRNTWHGMLWQKVELKFRIPILVLEIIWASNYSSQNLIPFPNSCENIRKIVYIYSILWTS